MDPRLDLDTVIRPNLARMEDELIINLFGRSWFKANGLIYVEGGIPIKEFLGCYLDFLHKEVEKAHALAGRFNHPEEYPFFEDLPGMVALRDEVSSPVRRTNSNPNPRIREVYLSLLGDFCEEGDDGQYGSAALLDIACLHTLSKRIRYGRYVAESKYQGDPLGYQKLIDAQDREGIIDKLRDLDVEREVLCRVREKGDRYGVDPQFVEGIYETSFW